MSEASHITVHQLPRCRSIEMILYFIEMAESSIGESGGKTPSRMNRISASVDPPRRSLGRIQSETSSARCLPFKSTKNAYVASGLNVLSLFSETLSEII